MPHPHAEPPSEPPSEAPDTSPLLFESSDESLLELVDNLLNRGVVLDAELVLGLAGVDLIYVHLSALLCAADRVLPRDRRRHAT